MDDEMRNKRRGSGTAANLWKRLERGKPPPTGEGSERRESISES